MPATCLKSLNFVALEPTLAWTLVLRRTLILREPVAVSRVDKMFVVKVFCKIVLQIGRGAFSATSQRVKRKICVQKENKTT